MTHLGGLHGDLICYAFLAENLDFLLLPTNLIFGLSEIVEGTFLKSPIFRRNFNFSDFRADFPLLRSYLDRTAYIF